MSQIRINKYLSQKGISSRRKAEELIKNGNVLVNGKPAIIGQKINDNDIVKVNEIELNQKIVELKYYLLNKPKKTICSLNDNFNRKTVIDLIDDSDYLFPIGRLDYDTTGVLLITNDGELANKLMHPSYEVERVYRARLNEPLTKKEFSFLNSNNVVLNGKISKQVIDQVDTKSYLISINEGSYHHIKKLFELVEKKVLDLKRVMFANLTCEKLMVGEYRKLTNHEIKQLKQLVSKK